MTLSHWRGNDKLLGYRVGQRQQLQRRSVEVLPVQCCALKALDLRDHQHIEAALG